MAVREAPPLIAEEPPLEQWPDGSIRVRGTRVLLEVVVSAYTQGNDPAEIAEMYDAISLADAYATVAYYLRHRHEVERYLRWVDAEARKIRRRIESEQAARRG